MTYTVRRFAPADAEGIAQLVTKVWGEAYPHRLLYHSAELMAAHAAGKQLSVVGVDETGRVVAHDALTIVSPGAAGELGQAMVDPECQGQGLMSRTRALLVEEARALGLPGLHGQPVVTHDHSQRVYEKLGFAPVGAQIGLVPGNLMADGKRGSTLDYYLCLSPPPGYRLFPPLRHAGMIASIYASLGRTPGDALAPAPVGPAIHWQESTDMGQCEIRVSDPERWALEQRALLARFAGHALLTLLLPLGHPATPAAAEQAECAGFHFAAAIPAYEGPEDMLLFNRLRAAHTAQPPAIAAARAREIFAYVESERLRAANIVSCRP